MGRKMSNSQEHLLLPSFEIGVSLNGHIEEFLLGPSAYTALVESDDDVDPFNFVEVWAYINKHIHEYLLDVVKHTGPIDTDKVRLVALTINIVAGPDDVDSVIECESCIDEYKERLEAYFSPGSSEGEDND